MKERACVSCKTNRTRLFRVLRVLRALRISTYTLNSQLILLIFINAKRSSVSFARILPKKQQKKKKKRFLQKMKDTKIQKALMC